MALNIPTMSLSKRMMINKDNARIIISVTGTAMIVAASLVAARALLDQRAFNGRIIAAKTAGRDTLIGDKAALEELAKQYTDFDKDPKVNSTKVLNALPSKYDFPAVAASIEKIFATQTGTQKYKLESFSGSDSQSTAITVSGTPTPQPIPYNISISGSYLAMQQFVKDLERSIRPMNVKSLEIGGTDNNLTMAVQVETYYQPAKKFEIGSKAVQ